MASQSWNPFSCCVSSGVAVANVDEDRRPIIRQQKSSSSQRVSSTSLGLSPEELSTALAQSGSTLRAFTYPELRAATRSFSRGNYLGRSGFGPVYRGFVDDGDELQAVAVKCLDLETGERHAGPQRVAG